jgi:hypothetical protein
LESELQCSAKLEEIALRAFVVFELVHPARVEVEMTLPYRCRVSKDRTDAEGMTHEQGILFLCLLLLGLYQKSSVARAPRIVAVSSRVDGDSTTCTSKVTRAAGVTAKL